MGEPEQAGAAASPREGSPAERADVVLTPDQRVRVFISSTLGELAPERAAARRAIARLHLVPVWYESGARPHPPRSMYRAYLRQSQVFVGIYWQRYGWVAPSSSAAAQRRNVVPERFPPGCSTRARRRAAGSPDRRPARRPISPAPARSDTGPPSRRQRDSGRSAPLPRHQPRRGRPRRAARRRTGGWSPAAGTAGLAR